MPLGAGLTPTGDPTAAATAATTWSHAAATARSRPASNLIGNVQSFENPELQGRARLVSEGANSTAGFIHAHPTNPLLGAQNHSI